MDKITLSGARNDYIAAFKEELEYVILSTGTTLDSTIDNRVIGNYTSSGHAEIRRLVPKATANVFETSNSVASGNALIFGVKANTLFSELALLKAEGDNYRVVGQIKLTPQQVNTETSFLVSNITIGVNDSE